MQSRTRFLYKPRLKKAIAVLSAQSREMKRCSREQFHLEGSRDVYRYTALYYTGPKLRAYHWTLAFLNRRRLYEIEAVLTPLPAALGNPAQQYRFRMAPVRVMRAASDCLAYYGNELFDPSDEAADIYEDAARVLILWQLDTMIRMMPSRSFSLKAHLNLYGLSRTTMADIRRAQEIATNHVGELKVSSNNPLVLKPHERVARPIIQE